jgi:hypothetical protein
MTDLQQKCTIDPAGIRDRYRPYVFDDFLLAAILRIKARRVFVTRAG